MTSDMDRVYVWTWLPGSVEPVVAGQLTRADGDLVFNYGQSYLGRDEAIPIYTPELPLASGELPLLPGLTMPGCLRDAAPDAWGRRVILNRVLGQQGAIADVVELCELTYLLESGSDRPGALDFQSSPTDYVPRTADGASLDDLSAAAEKVEAGVPLTSDLDAALHHASSIGGARPKALIDDGNRKWVAKFSSSSDVYSVVKAEFIGMRLAKQCGLDVASVELTQALNKDVLLIERFDRRHTDLGWQRCAMVSALTLLALDEMLARYASYEDLAEIVRHRFDQPKATLREIFGRLVFNVLCGNTDDHARNHAAFWNGSDLALTPAYDICPQSRGGNEASQSMKIDGDNNLSQIAVCLKSAHHYLLEQSEAIDLVASYIKCIGEYWEEVCDSASVSATDQSLLAQRQILNPFAFEQLSGDARVLGKLARQTRQGPLSRS